MSDENLKNILEVCREIALEAGSAITAIENEPRTVAEKVDGSPVTRADMHSHKVIAEGLCRFDPDIPVISEEGEIKTVESANCFRYWLVDPLDGTKEFIKGLPEYTVNIALVEDSDPVLGVIYVPAAKVIYWASRGGGTFRRADKGEAERLHVRRESDRLTAVVSRSHSSAETRHWLVRNGVRKTIPSGSSLKMCLVAEGVADVYPRLGPTWYWDTGVGTIIARESGCCVTDLDGIPLSYSPRAILKHQGFVVYSPFSCKPDVQTRGRY
ncbi:MAG: 3'(2'),5'-bisphosphate nucleotidase CysQ [Candidatus Pacebacteria bacterium]|nr:3'(2'),5'-bisphosphate nucleotidase CysQ [Candidatus Paceibacterota bacterium]